MHMRKSHIQDNRSQPSQWTIDTFEQTVTVILDHDSQWHLYTILPAKVVLIAILHLAITTIIRQINIHIVQRKM